MAFVAFACCSRAKRRGVRGIILGSKIYDSPSLVQVNNKHHIIPEAGQTVSGRHYDNECKYVVNKGVEGLEKQNENQEGDWRN